MKQAPIFEVVLGANNVYFGRSGKRALEVFSEYAAKVTLRSSIHYGKRLRITVDGKILKETE